MILLKNVPFEKRLQVLYDNICAYPTDPAFAETIGGYADGLQEGLLAYQGLLRSLYTDGSGLQGADDDKRYAELLDSLHLLQACFEAGAICEEGQKDLHVDKPALQQRYKRGSIGKKVRYLASHGISIQYLAGDGAKSASLSKAAQLSLSYSSSPALVPAVKAFADAIQALETPSRTWVYNELGVFGKADYRAAFLGQPPLRDALDPLWPDVLATVGDHAPQWVHLVNRLLHSHPLNCSGFLFLRPSPSWSVSFAEGRKRPLIIFTLGPSIVFIEFTLPLASAEAIILARSGYSQAVRERIEAFRCVKCPKKCKGSNMHKIDGVSLCTGRAEARRIYLTLSPEDFDSIHAMLDLIYA